LLIHHFCI